MRRLLLCSTSMKRPTAFFNTMAGSTLWICATPQPVDLTAGQFAALAWVQIKGVGHHGKTGAKTNILNYDTWDTQVIQKGKGNTDAGSPDIEMARIPSDPGQILLQAAALVNSNYAFRILRNDATNVSGTPTTRYNRGLVTGPEQPNGRNEDFDLEIFTLGLQQLQITVDPSAAGNPPKETVAPAITGTAQVNSVLTTSNGTFTGDAVITYTYRWHKGGVFIPGATANTYVPVTADIGFIITCTVTATNAAGSAAGVSAPSAAVIA